MKRRDKEWPIEYRNKRPFFKGTRISVELFRIQRSQGYSIEQFHEDYPWISLETLRKL